MLVCLFPASPAPPTDSARRCLVGAEPSLCQRLTSEGCVLSDVASAAERRAETRGRRAETLPGGTEAVSVLWPRRQHGPDAE